MDNGTNILQQNIKSANNKYIFFACFLFLIYIVLLVLYIKSSDTSLLPFFGSIGLTLLFGFVIFYFLASFNAVSNKGDYLAFNYYKYGYLTLGLIILLSILLSVLYLLGLFSPVSTDTDNTANLLLNYFVIITLIIFFVIAFLQIKSTINANANNTLIPYNGLTSIFQSIASINSIKPFIIYILFITLLYSLNPLSIATTYYYPFLYFIIFIAIIFLVIFTIKMTTSTNSKIGLPPIFKDLFDTRLYYTIALFIFIFIIAGIYLYNPWDIITQYGGPTIFILLFMVLIMLGMITIFNYFFMNPSKIESYKNSPGLTMFFQSIYVLVGVFFSGLMLYWFLNVLGTFNQDSTVGGDIGHVVLNLIILIGALSIIYKIANAGGFLENNPIFRFIVNIGFYIPCLFVGFIDILNEMFTGVDTPGKTSKADLFFLILAITIIGLYLLFKFILIPMVTQYYYTQGGKQLINQPLPINELTNISTYHDLNDIDTTTNTTADKFSYQYAMSCWIYIDALPPNTNSSYLNLTPILSYGGNPAIKYNASTNTLTITVKQEPDPVVDPVVVDPVVVVEPVVVEPVSITPDKIAEWNALQSKKNVTNSTNTTNATNELDANGDRIIYKNTDWLLQKWNNIILNYNGGTLDVFINGELLKSAIEVVPYMRYEALVSGTDNGVFGEICNLMYFKKTLDVMSIYFLYNSFKDKKPPSLDTNDKQLISNK